MTEIKLAILHQPLLLLVCEGVNHVMQKEKCDVEEANFLIHQLLSVSLQALEFEEGKKALELFHKNYKEMKQKQEQQKNNQNN